MPSGSAVTPSGGWRCVSSPRGLSSCIGPSCAVTSCRRSAGFELSEISTEDVRFWHAVLVRTTSAISAAKCYRRSDGCLPERRIERQQGDIEAAADRSLRSGAQWRGAGQTEQLMRSVDVRWAAAAAHAVVADGREDAGVSQLM